MIGGAGGITQLVGKNLSHLPMNRRSILRPERGLVPVNRGFESPRLRLGVSLLLRIFQMATGETSETENNSKQCRAFYVQSVIS